MNEELFWQLWSVSMCCSFVALVMDIGYYRQSLDSNFMPIGLIFCTFLSLFGPLGFIMVIIWRVKK